MQNTSITILIPAFNEEANLEASVGDNLRALKKHFTDFELIILNDGSTEQTAQVA